MLRRIAVLGPASGNPARRRPGPAPGGRTRELKSLAVELLSAFEAREIRRESMAVLLLFQRSCEEERLTAELARQLGSLLRRGKG